MNDALAAAASAPPTTDSRRERWLDRLVHPIVLKELRQASRGAFVLRAMLIVQLLAFGLAAVTLLLETDALESSDIGLKLFSVAVGCAILATCAVVPFFGFLSLGAEREMSTIDLLHLTRLRPRGIVFGKLAACFVLTLEFCASLAPLLVLSYLLPGLDLRTVIAAMIVIPVASLALSACAIGMSGIVTSRLGRALASVVLILGLFLVGLYGFFGVLAELRFSGSASSGMLVGMFVGAIAVIAPIAILLLAAGIVPLTHPEENRAFAPRIAMLVVALLTPIVVLVFEFLTGLDDEGVAALQIYTIILLALCGVAAMTEPEVLPRRTARTPSRLPALLRAPFVAGGGRGFLFFVLVAITQIVAVEAVRAWGNGNAGRLKYDVFGDGAYYGPVAALAYAIALFGPISALWSTTDRARKRIRPRVWMIASPFLLALIAIAIGYAASGPRGAERVSESGWNPFWLIAEAADDVADPTIVAAIELVMIAAVVAMLINLPRVVAGIAELRAAASAHGKRRD